MLGRRSQPKEFGAGKPVGCDGQLRGMRWIFSKALAQIPGIFARSSELACDRFQFE